MKNVTGNTTEKVRAFNKFQNKKAGPRDDKLLLPTQILKRFGAEIDEQISPRVGKRDIDGKKKTRIRMILERVPGKTREVRNRVLRGDLGIEAPRKPPDLDLIDLTQIKQNVERRDDLSPADKKEKKRLDQFAELYIRRVDCRKPDYLGEDRQPQCYNVELSYEAIIDEFCERSGIIDKA